MSRSVGAGRSILSNTRPAKADRHVQLVWTPATSLALPMRDNTLRCHLGNFPPEVTEKALINRAFSLAVPVGFELVAPTDAL